MSAREATGWRSSLYSDWHRSHRIRRFLPPDVAEDMTMVDIDALMRCERWVEACRGCYEPLTLIETYVDNHQTYKCATALGRLARRAGIEAYVVRYEPNQARDDIERFHVRRVEPWRDDWHVFLPAAYAAFLVRARGRGSHTCTCAQEAAA